jgi:DNA adenine methylase
LQNTSSNILAISIATFSFKAIQQNVDRLIEVLIKLEEKYLILNIVERKNLYYNIRDLFNNEKTVVNYKEISEQSIIHASKFLFLNKTCFNGLYRLNRKGEFNVPIGSYINPTICNKDNLLEAHKSLQNIELLSNDFEQLTSNVDENTFVYIDPPYRPLNSTSNFNSYSKTEFNDNSQVRLKDWFSILDKKGAYLMMSNSDPHNIDNTDNFFDELYKDYNIQIIFASRAINSNGSSRGKISEFIITNYLPEENNL